MKTSFVERLDSFHAAPFTVQRICELLADPRKQYSRIDKFMRAIEKNLLVVSTLGPGRLKHTQENVQSVDSIINGDISSESIDSDDNDFNPITISPTVTTIINEQIIKDIKAETIINNDLVDIKNDSKIESTEKKSNKNDDKIMDDNNKIKSDNDKKDEIINKMDTTIDETTTITVAAAIDKESKLIDLPDNISKEIKDEKKEQQSEPEPSTSESSSCIKSELTQQQTANTSTHSLLAKFQDSKCSEYSSEFLEKIKIIEEKFAYYVEMDNCGKGPGKALEEYLSDIEKVHELDQELKKYVENSPPNRKQTRSWLSAMAIATHPALNEILAMMGNRAELPSDKDLSSISSSSSSSSSDATELNDKTDEIINKPSSSSSSPPTVDSTTAATIADENILNQDDKEQNDLIEKNDDWTPTGPEINDSNTNDSLSQSDSTSSNETDNKSSEENSSSSSQETLIDTINKSSDIIPPVTTTTDDVPILKDDVIKENIVDDEKEITATTTTTIESDDIEAPITDVPQTESIIPTPTTETSVPTDIQEKSNIIEQHQSPIIEDNEIESIVTSPMQSSESGNEMDTTNSNEIKMDDEEDITGGGPVTVETEFTKITDDVAMDIDDAVEPMDQ